jgi:hypothetical protein
MRRISLSISFIAVACLATVSCQRLDTNMCPKPSATPAKVAQPSPRPAVLADAIPSDYGTPIGVTPDPTRPQQVAVWFAKPDRSIVAVFIEVEQGKLSDRTLTIPRK